MVNKQLNVNLDLKRKLQKQIKGFEKAPFKESYIARVNRLVEKVLNEDENFIQFGSFHDDPESIYFNKNSELKDSFKNRDFDNFKTVSLEKQNLIFLEANDESIYVHETNYKTKDEFIKALKDSYSEAKQQRDEGYAAVEVGTGDSDEPDVWRYFGGYIIEDEEDLESADAFCKVLIDWFNGTYIDRDSSFVYCLIDPKTLKIVLGGNVSFWKYEPNEWGDSEDEEDYDESFKSKKSNKRKLKESMDKDISYEVKKPIPNWEIYIPQACYLFSEVDGETARDPWCVGTLEQCYNAIIDSIFEEEDEEYVEDILEYEKIDPEFRDLLKKRYETENPF